MLICYIQLWFQFFKQSVCMLLFFKVMPTNKIYSAVYTLQHPADFVAKIFRLELSSVFVGCITWHSVAAPLQTEFCQCEEFFFRKDVSSNNHQTSNTLPKVSIYIDIIIEGFGALNNPIAQFCINKRVDAPQTRKCVRICTLVGRV